MLITLRTQNALSDTSRFQNFYTEGLTIPSNSRLALVNMSYNVADEIALSDNNNTFEVRVANQDAFQTITIPTGNYADVSALETAIDAALKAHFNAQSNYIQSLFLPTDQSFTVSNNNLATFHLVYKPATIPSALLSAIQQPAGTAINVFRSEVANIDGSQGYYATQLLYDDSITPTFLTTDADVRADDLVLVPSIVSADSTYASYSCVTVDIGNYNTRNDIIGLADVVSQGNVFIPIQVEFDYVANILTVKEKGADGTLNVVSNPSTVPLVTAQKLEIRIPQFEDDTPNVFKNASYFYNNRQIPLTGVAANRYQFDFRTNFFPRFAFAQPELGQLKTGTNNGLALTGTQPANQGLNYKVGEILAQNSSTGPGINMKVCVLDVNYIAPGLVTEFIITDPGSGHVEGNTVTFQGAGNARVFKLLLGPIGTAQPTITTAGTGYQDQSEVKVKFPGATPVGGAEATATLSSAGGTVISIEIKPGSEGRGYKVGDLCGLERTGGVVSSFVTITSLVNAPSVCHDLSATLTNSAVLNNPLLAEPNAHLRFDNQLLRNILDMKRIYDGKVGLEAEAKGPIASNNTSSNIAHIQVDDFNMESREAENGSVGGVSGKTIAAVCIGKRQPDAATADEGFYFDEPFNLIYHSLNNPEQIVNNQINVRITDETNVPFVGLQHPVTLTLDLRSKK